MMSVKQMSAFSLLTKMLQELQKLLKIEKPAKEDRQVLISKLIGQEKKKGEQKTIRLLWIEKLMQATKKIFNLCFRSPLSFCVPRI